MGIKLNSVYQEDCLETMGRMSSLFVDLVITSPPYRDLRDYKGYNFKFEETAHELYRTLKDGGVLVWVCGDKMIDGSESLDSFKQAIYFKESCGFKLLDTMIFQKHNFSNPARNKYHQIFEYMMIFVKGEKPKTFNGIKDRPNICAGQVGSWGKNTVRQKDGSMKERKRAVNSEYGLRHNIWKYRTGAEGKLAHKHPAPFPYLLASDHIKTWTDKDQLVYDPMAGSGSTIVAARDLGRNFIGSEISAEYCKNIIIPRLKMEAKRCN